MTTPTAAGTALLSLDDALAAVAGATGQTDQRAKEYRKVLTAGAITFTLNRESGDRSAPVQAIELHDAAYVLARHEEALCELLRRINTDGKRLLSLRAVRRMIGALRDINPARLDPDDDGLCRQVAHRLGYRTGDERAGMVRLVLAALQAPAGEGTGA